MCLKCSGLGFLRADVPPGHPQFGRPIACDGPEHQPSRTAWLVQVSGLMEEDLTRRLADIRPIRTVEWIDDPERPGQKKQLITGNEAMLAAARSTLANPCGWLWIHGGPGNAKSEILFALINELNLSSRGPAVYAKFSSLIDYMRDAFTEKNRRDKDPFTDLGYIARFERLKSIPVLAIDEMDKARDTAFMEDFRFDFLDERYRQAVNGKTLTIFASNTHPSGLPDALWDRVRDGRFAVVHNTAGSARPMMGR